MRKFLLCSVGLVAILAVPAMAADMPIKAPPPPPVAYYDWSGAYIGLNVGETWYDVDRAFPNAFRSGGLTPGSRGNLGPATMTASSAFTQARNGNGAHG
jgi:opacity protein-like surface antigen